MRLSKALLLFISLVLALVQLSCANPRVRLVHAISGAPSVALFAQNKATGISGIAFAKVSDYVKLQPGIWNLQLNSVVSNNNSTTGTPIVNATFELVSHTNYSLIALLSKTTGTPSLTLKVDDNTPPRPRFASLRFIHLAYTQPLVPVNVALNGAPVYLDFSYGQASAYQIVPSGPYNLEFRVANDQHTLLTTVPNVELQPRTVYTIYALGNGQVIASISTDNVGKGFDACTLCNCPNEGSATSNSEVNLVFEDLLPAKTSCCKGFLKPVSH